MGFNWAESSGGRERAFCSGIRSSGKSLNAMPETSVPFHHTDDDYMLNWDDKDSDGGCC